MWLYWINQFVAYNAFYFYDTYCNRKKLNFWILFNKYIFFFKINIVFAAFYNVRNLQKALNQRTFVVFFDMLPSIFLICFEYLMQLITVYSGSSVTTEANKISTNIGKLMSGCSFDHYFELQKFLTQIQTRNLNIQNIFVKINWSLLVVVSSSRNL